jgi:hypothetical protein
MPVEAWVAVAQIGTFVVIAAPQWWRLSGRRHEAVGCERYRHRDNVINADYRDLRQSFRAGGFFD